MIPVAFDYVRAGSLADALAALAAKDGTKVIAGSHSLLPVMKFRLAQPPRLLDIGGLAELKGIADHEGGVRIGAATTYRELLDAPLVQARVPILVECTHQIGDVQVRNRGTIGGALAHADPASDLPAVMVVLDATMVLRSARGERRVRAREFFEGPFTTALAEDELLTHVLVPALPAGAGTAYVAQNAAASGYAIAACAALVTRSAGTVTAAAAALTGVGDMTRLIPSVAALVGTAGDAAAIAAAAAGAVDGLDVQGDVHAPAEYRAHLAKVIAGRALQLALSRAR